MTPILNIIFRRGRQPRPPRDDREAPPERTASSSVRTRYQRKRPQTTHHRDIPDSLTITLERHAFEGQSLAVISIIRRRGVLLVLVVLPDGSSSPTSRASPP